MNFQIKNFNFLSKELKLPRMAISTSIAVLFSSWQPMLAQGVAPTLSADQGSLNSTSLQAILSQTVENVRDRQLNTVATVIWPILPQDNQTEENFEDKEIGRIRIPNSQFLTLNQGNKTDLIKENPSAKEIIRLLEGDKSEIDYMNQLLENWEDQDSSTALSIGLDRRRVLEILEKYGGSEFAIDVNNGQEIRKIDDLVWEFIPYKITSTDGTPYYRFKVTVRAENLGININGQAGSRIPVKFTMSLKEDPNMPPIRSFNSSEIERNFQATNEDRAKDTAKQLGAGETNPLLLLVGLSSGQFAQQAGTALLNTGGVSAIAGVVFSGEGTEAAGGINTSVHTIAKKVEIGVAAALPGGDDLYLGPSISLGNGTLVLSPGFVVETDGDTRFSGLASLDLSRLLFGKPGTDNLGGKTIDIPPQEVRGIYTSQEILSGNPIVKINFPTDQINRINKTIIISDPTTENISIIKSEKFAIISDLEPNDYKIQICEKDFIIPPGGGLPIPDCREKGELVISSESIQIYELSNLIP